MMRAGDPAEYFVRMIAGAKSNMCMSVAVSWTSPRSLCSPHCIGPGFPLPRTAFGRRCAFENGAGVASCVITRISLFCCIDSIHTLCQIVALKSSTQSLIVHLWPLGIYPHAKTFDASQLVTLAAVFFVHPSIATTMIEKHFSCNQTCFGSDLHSVHGGLH